jgi:hypothetical protein
VPGLDYGLGIRTRRARPSEKTAPGVVPGFSPQGHPSWAGSPEGAGSARPERKPTLHPGISPSGDGPFAQSFSGIENPGHTRGHAPRAHGVRPSEKIASRVISGLSRVGDRRCARPPLGGAGLCTPAAKSLASSRDLPLDQGFSPAPWGKGNPSAFARPCHKAAGRGSLAAEPQCSSTSYPGEGPVWMRGSCSSGVFLTHGVRSPSIFQGNFILGSGQGRSCLVP